MFEHQGIWLPDGEAHFPGWMTKNGEIVDGRGTYQIKKWRACLPWIKNWSTAVDVGGHVGFWSIQMAARFEYLHTFEPKKEFRECWARNVRATNACLHAVALGAEPGLVAMRVPSLNGGIDSGGTHVAMDHGQIVNGGDIEMRTLDSFGFNSLDYLKVDCEGYEHHVIEGARETILRCRPCIVVEQKAHKMAQNYPGLKGTPAVDLLLAMGAKQRALLSGDHILSWD